MDYKNALLGGVAGLLALTAGVQDPANASVQRTEPLTQAAPPSRSGGGIGSEALIDLLMRTNGAFSSDAIENAIADMYSNPSREQIQNAPELLRDFAALGLSAEGIQRLRDVLGDFVSSAENFEEELRASVIADLNADVTPFVLAQVRRACTREELRNPRLRAGCDPEQVGQTGQPPRDPDQVGQVGGGYQ